MTVIAIVGQAIHISGSQKYLKGIEVLSLTEILYLALANTAENSKCITA